MRHELLAGQYRDSVSLMRLSSALEKHPGIIRVSAVMASPANLDLLREAGLLHGELAAEPNDLIIAAAGEADAVDAVLAEARAAVLQGDKSPASGAGRDAVPPRCLDMLESEEPQLAFISTPGAWAAHEAWKAVKRGLHVMIFSDNVPVEEEAALKRFATERGLLVMGPDCGTAILGGTPLGFANVVRRGSIGVVGASGTGMQQICCLVHQWGQGISQAIGVGGHDLSREVGGLTMSLGLRMLAEDSATRVIVMVSKPPSPDVARALMKQAASCGKPVVVNFLGDATAAGTGLHPAATLPAVTLEDAARLAVELAGGQPPTLASDCSTLPSASVTTPRHVRGVFSGGTFCYEAALLLSHLADLHTNTPLRPEQRLQDPWHSHGHCLVDMGDDVFTRGRPHPMIDDSLRLSRLAEECADPSVAVILLDVVLGHGAHASPAASLAAVLARGKRQAEEQGRELAVIAFVCGTDQDPQGMDAQCALLREAGCVVLHSSTEAARCAAHVAEHGTLPTAHYAEAQEII